MQLYQWAAGINRRQYLVAGIGAIMMLYLRRTLQGSDDSRAKTKHRKGMKITYLPLAVKLPHNPNAQECDATDAIC